MNITPKLPISTHDALDEYFMALFFLNGAFCFQFKALIFGADADDSRFSFWGQKNYMFKIPKQWSKGMSDYKEWQSARFYIEDAFCRNVMFYEVQSHGVMLNAKSVVDLNAGYELLTYIHEELY